MNCWIATAGVGLLLVGLLVAFNIDLMWRLNQFGKSLEGIKTERTEGWEQMNGLKGLLLIVGGLGVIVYAFLAR
jgi:hypothetical protein